MQPLTGRPNPATPSVGTGSQPVVVEWSNTGETVERDERSRVANSEPVDRSNR